MPDPKSKEKAMKGFFCALYPTQGCNTCASTCYDTDNPNKECPWWSPMRAGHPSTPMPCEGFGFGEGVCWDEECITCPHAKRHEEE